MCDIPQPDPIVNREVAVWELVIDDMKKRDAMGVRKYGTHLQPFNGRNALWDLYQELLDSVVYTRQKIYEDEDISGWSYISGIIDGEGCISVNYDKTHTYLRIAIEITMTDREPLDWICEFTKFGKVYEKKDYRPNRRTPYKWAVSNSDEISKIIEKILPYIKVKKSEAIALKILLSLRSCKTNGKRDYPDIENKVYEIIKKLKHRNTSYQEALDLVVYLRQAIYENEHST